MLFPEFDIDTILSLMQAYVHLHPERKFKIIRILLYNDFDREKAVRDDCMIELLKLEVELSKNKNDFTKVEQCLDDLYTLVFDYRERATLPHSDVYNSNAASFDLFFTGQLMTLQRKIEDVIGDNLFMSHQVALFINLTRSILHVLLYKGDLSDDSLREAFATTQRECLDLFLCESYYTEQMLKNISFLPNKLLTPKAMISWKKLVVKGFINNKLEPVQTTSTSQLTYIAKKMSDMLDFKDNQGRYKWSVFENLWKVKYLSQYNYKNDVPDESVIPRIKEINDCF